jgi:hypothetical protein
MKVNDVSDTLLYPTNALNNMSYMHVKEHIKIIKSAPTCLGSRRNHHQGAEVSA